LTLLISSLTVCAIFQVKLGFTVDLHMLKNKLTIIVASMLWAWRASARIG
jgi:hypothetical protein